MPKLVEYQDGDVEVTSRKPLRGTLELVTDDDDTVDMLLDRENAEWLMSALVEFLMHGEGNDMPKISIGQQSRDGNVAAKKDRAATLTALFEGILSAFHATAHEGNEPFENCQIFAEVALASLESSGFKVVRDKRPTAQS